MLMGVVLLCFISPAMAAGQIDVEVTTHLGDKQVYQEGDEVSFLVSINSDAYLLILYQDAEGNLMQLLPNHLIENTKYTQGMFLPIPSAKSPFVFHIQAPYGEETIWVFAADQPFPRLIGTTLENGVTLLEGKIEENVNYLRQKIEEMDAAYGEGKATIVTQKK